MVEKQPKKAVVLDGTQTRVLLDLSKDFINENPKTFISGKKSNKVKPTE